jgi:hypothetical protein
VRTQLSPDNSIDLIGFAARYPSTTPTNDSTFVPGAKDSGAIQSFCQSTSSSEKYGCRCVFQFVPSDGGTTPVSIEVDPTYVEPNLARCPIPGSALNGSFDVFLKRQSTPSYSNKRNFTMAPTYDFNSLMSYQQIDRYTCRYLPFITGIMDPAVIDPLLLTSKSNAFERTYYTSNRGGALAAFAGLSSDDQREIHCPPHVNSSQAALSLVLTKSNTSPNLTITDSSDATLIASDGKDYLSFYLSKKSIPPFVREIAISPAPGVAPTSSSSSSGNLSQGYAAIPDSSDACPSSTPSGMAWKKLWLFVQHPSERIRPRVPHLEKFAMSCQAVTVPGDVTNGKFRNSTTIANKDLPGAAPAKTYRANDYFFYNDCGRNSGALGVWSSDTDDAIGVGIDEQSFGECSQVAGRVPVSNFKDMLLLPTGSSSSLTHNDFHRCITVSGSTWEDRCDTSRFSCFSNASWDSFGLCNKAVSSRQLKTEFSGSDIWYQPIGLPSSDLLFVITDTSETSSSISNWQVTRSTGAGVSNSQPYVASLGTQNDLQIQFPLCVLQRSP